jgi:ligand-binding sensor domain-containing protein
VHYYKMRIALIISFSLIMHSIYAQNEIGAIGSWREHYNNSNITQAVKGDRIYLAAKNQLIAYNESNGQIEYIGKSSGLHEIGIQKIAWDSKTEQLLVAYTNSAIDIVKGDQVYLINDIKTTTLYNNKQINNIKIANGLAFIETAFGIVVIDLLRHEIKETWQNKDLAQVENKYQLSNINNTASITFQTDSIKGIAIAPNLNKWIALGGPKKPTIGIASANSQQMIFPFSNQKNGFASYSENGWTNYFTLQNNAIPNIDYSVSHPSEPIFWLSNTNTIYSFDGNQIQLVQESPIGKIKNITFSKNGNGWILNDQKGLNFIQKNNTKAYSFPTGFTINGIVQIIANQQEQVWIASSSLQGVFIFQSDNYFNTSTWVQKTTGTNNGNLPSNKVTSITEDKTGAIWVGTDNGIGIFNCGDISKEACNAYLPIVQNNGFNAYLFQKETINCITVDAANRKWVGTNNGAWLVSQDGLSIIEHFTKDNSPLPTDSISQIIIEPNNGEVFFQTSQELVSYRGTATKEATHQKDLFIYPNPVPPNYDGQISIKNLVENANVKITDINGKLVFQTRALGGQAIWNGKTYEGKHVATGIYLVFVRDDIGNEKGVGKIMITKGY